MSKLTAKQREVLEKMRDGWEVHEYPGFNWACSIKQMRLNLQETLHGNVFFALLKRQFIKKVEGQHENAHVVHWELTDKGRGALK